MHLSLNDETNQLTLGGRNVVPEVQPSISGINTDTCSWIRNCDWLMTKIITMTSAPPSFRLLRLSIYQTD